MSAFPSENRVKGSGNSYKAGLLVVFPPLVPNQNFTSHHQHANKIHVLKLAQAPGIYIPALANERWMSNSPAGSALISVCDTCHGGKFFHSK